MKNRYTELKIALRVLFVVAACNTFGIAQNMVNYAGGNAKDIGIAMGIKL